MSTTGMFMVLAWVALGVFGSLFSPAIAALFRSKGILQGALDMAAKADALLTAFDSEDLEGFSKALGKKNWSEERGNWTAALVLVISWLWPAFLVFYVVRRFVAAMKACAFGYVRLMNSLGERAAGINGRKPEPKNISWNITNLAPYRKAHQCERCGQNLPAKEKSA